MTIKVGDTLPSATFMTMTANGPSPVTSDELFAGRTVALFAVPGAFTPTCSAKHLPSFTTNIEALRARGVEKVLGVSVNDVFVMGAWAKSENLGDEIQLLADGNGDFARAIGMDVDTSKFGMGTRSRRYSMLVEDRVVIQLNVEEGGEFRVSSGDYMLGQLSDA